MEEILRKLQKDASGNKYKAIRDACGVAYETLNAQNGSIRMSPSKLRERCLYPLQLALESKNPKLAQTALAGMQKILCEDRFVAVESEVPEKQLLNQMLEVVSVTPSLHEDLQVEVMKVLLCVTYSSSFEMTGNNILKIAELCIQIYTPSCHQRSINTAVRATLSQILGDLTLQLHHRKDGSTADGLESSVPTYQRKGTEMVAQKQLCPVLVVIMGNPVNDKTITSAHGTPSQEVDATSGPGVSDQGRGSGCSSSAPAMIGPVIRTICYIAAELVRLVSCVESMKPVLQSLYHRMLLYPPPQHRVEAMKIMKEILGSPQRLFDLAGPCVLEPEPRKRSFTKRKSYLDLFKLVMDGMTEACIKGGVEACYSSVSCACALLAALDELSQGRGLQMDQAQLLLRRLDDLKEGAELELNEADFWRQRHVLSSERAAWEAGLSQCSPDISISVTTDTGQTTLEGGLGRTTPEDRMDDAHLPSPSFCGGAAGESGAPPDVVQRSHALAYPDLTNFLSVESRTRSHGSRYSESNFSVDEQELSRTEFDSCDQFSTAAEKDSGRSDVSDVGSDNGSLADDEQTLRQGPAHCSLHTAALSLKLLKNQEADQQSARLFVQSLAALLPRLLVLQCPTDVDVALQNFSSTFCSGLQAGGMHSPGFEASENLSCQALMNADGLYLVSYYALLLNLKLCTCDFYQQKVTPHLVTLKEFVHQIQSSGVLVVLSQAWIEELFHQVIERNLLAEAGYSGSPEDHSLPLITMLTDIDGLGSSAIGGQLIRRATSQSPFTSDNTNNDTVLAGTVFARYILIGCWKNLIDVLSTPLTGRMAGNSRALAFIIGADGAKVQNQRERDTICLSLDGLRKAAALSCALGVAANCASAVAQMAAASCVPEEKEEKELVVVGDAITQVKQRMEQKLEQIGRYQGVKLHTAHMLCMDAILNVGLEMGSHNHDCWPHVFRVVEYVSSLEHSHFSDGSSQPPLAITQTQQASSVMGNPELSTESSPELELSLSHPVIQPLTIQELLRDNSQAKNSDLRSGGLLTGTSAAKAVCTLSTQADRLFEDAVSKLNLVSLVGFLHQLRKASQSQLFNSDTETGDYSLAIPGEAKSTQDKRTALHLFRLGEAMLRIVRNKSRPLLHMMRAWSVVAPHLVEAACHKERHVSQKAVSFIHDVLMEVLSSWAELSHFHFNEALFRPFEHIMQLELCDEDVQDQLFREMDYKQIGDCVHANGFSSTDLCLPALDYLRKCSQLLAKIYKMPLKPVFLGARLASLPMRAQERSVISDDGMDCVLSEFDDDTDMGYESLINLMLKDLFKLLVACVAEPAETISRVGCSCIRYVLVTAGPVFTEEMWRLACCALQDAFSATLEAVKNLLACFRSGSDTFTGDACEVKVAAPTHSASAEAEYLRIRAMAQQVFMLDTQCSPKTPNSKEGFEHAQSCVLIIELPADQQSNGHTQKRKIGIPFRTIVVSLLSHQVLLQNLYDILLEEFVKGSGSADVHDRLTPVSEPKAVGFLRYISMQNLAIILDLLLESYRTARDFDTRPGLKYLLMKVSGVCGAANLYRQSAMSFNIFIDVFWYFQAVLCAMLTNQEQITVDQVKKILSEEEEDDSSQACSSEDEDIFDETARVSPPRRWRTRMSGLSTQPVSGTDWAWLLKRMHKVCMDLCTNYIQMHLDMESSTEELPSTIRTDSLFFLPLFPSESSTPSTGGHSGHGTPLEDCSPRLYVPSVPSFEEEERRRKKEWWENAGNKLYTIATDKTIAKLMMEYKKRKQHQQQQQHHSSLTKKTGERMTPESPAPQRPQLLVDQRTMRHSFSAGPELLRQDKRPRSGSTASSHNISIRDSEAQIQAWTNMVLTMLNQIQSLPDATFVALQPAVFPCISQLTCHVIDLRVRQAVREWLGRVGRVYDIVL
ncbi:brefeldin A-inhibited guanine nucleotide-exchange protein 3-like [Trichomycterus rosablanca]|uniref:brefeldin A-inhibited guanine nucleotide-exchange protein 3-like n=1 Tax=Trichomycterus rosablanca TaxID=2290929 RepID=UPI002F353EB4